MTRFLFFLSNLFHQSRRHEFCLWLCLNSNAFWQNPKLSQAKFCFCWHRQTFLLGLESMIGHLATLHYTVSLRLRGLAGNMVSNFNQYRRLATSPVFPEHENFSSILCAVLSELYGVLYPLYPAVLPRLLGCDHYTSRIWGRCKRLHVRLSRKIAPMTAFCRRAGNLRQGLSVRRYKGRYGLLL